MGFSDLWRILKKTPKTRGNPLGFDDIARENSQIQRKYQAEIKKLKNEIELEKLKGELVELKRSVIEARNVGGAETGGDETDAMFDKFLRIAELQALNQPKTPNTAKEKVQEEEPEPTLTAEDIDEIMKKTPKSMLKKARKLEFEDLAKKIGENYPSLNSADCKLIAKEILKNPENDDKQKVLDVSGV